MGFAGGRPRLRRSNRRAIGGALALLSCASAARLTSLNGQVVAGQATIATTAPNTLTIDQTTPRAAIDWQSFNIAPNETTRFVQPSPNAVALNRVQAGDPSVIAGRLPPTVSLSWSTLSGGRLHPGFAGQRAQQPGGDDGGHRHGHFMAGKMVFDQPGNPKQRGSGQQRPYCVAQAAGLAALVAPGVANNGVISARLGRVVLGGAQTYTLDFYGDGLIQFDVGSPVATAPLGRNGQPVASLVSNSGQINAPGGTVLLTAWTRWPACSTMSSARRAGSTRRLTRRPLAA